MSLLQMSISGAIMILVVIVVRSILIQRLPKRTFYILWGVVMLRLLLPIQIFSDMNLYSWIQHTLPALQTRMESQHIQNGIDKGQDLELQEKMVENPMEQITNNQDITKVQETGTFRQNSRITEPSKGIQSVLSWIWLVGALLLFLYFLWNYIKCNKEFQISLPIQNEWMEGWLKDHPMKRQIRIRMSEFISSPLTYGVIHPVILLPKSTDWSKRESLQYVLEHEYVHIRRFDLVIKFLMMAAICLHWFNPMVWCMYLLMNRDIELSCDESVVYHFGIHSRSDYAYTLIEMEAKKSKIIPYYSSFSRNSIEERIKSIMKVKKSSVLTVLITVFLILGIGSVFGTSAVSEKKEENAELLNVISKEDYIMLKDLQFKGYEAMSIVDYREKTLQYLDGSDSKIHLIFDDLYINRTLDDMKDRNADLGFLFYVMVPLNAEKWTTRDFGGFAATDDSDVPDNAMLEYTIRLTILDAKHLKVKEYDNARTTIVKEMNRWMENRSKDELKDEGYCVNSLDEYIEGIEKQYTTEDLQVQIVNWNFKPLVDDNFIQEVRKESKEPPIEHATESDYESFMKLLTDNYKTMSVEQFDRQLLDWSDEHQSEHDRIMNDGVWNEYQVSLSNDEKSFVELTCRLSNEENAAYVRSLNSGQEENPMFNIDLPAKEERLDDSAYSARLWYQYSYHLLDKDQTTIGERDRSISGFLHEIESFWNDTKMRKLFTMTEADIISHLQEIAKKYSTEHLVILVEPDRVQYEMQDETRS